MPVTRFVAAGELLKVLSSPVRLAIITRLAEGPAAVHDLTAVTGQSQPLISQHLRVLRSMRLIQVTARGRERVYELVDDHVARIVSDALRHTAEPSLVGSAADRSGDHVGGQDLEHHDQEGVTA